MNRLESPEKFPKRIIRTLEQIDALEDSPEEILVLDGDSLEKGSAVFSPGRIAAYVRTVRLCSQYLIYTTSKKVSGGEPDQEALEFYGADSDLSGGDYFLRAEKPVVLNALVRRLRTILESKKVMYEPLPGFVVDMARRVVTVDGREIRQMAMGRFMLIAGIAMNGGTHGSSKVNKYYSDYIDHGRQRVPNTYQAQIYKINKEIRPFRIETPRDEGVYRIIDTRIKPTKTTR